MNQTKDSSVLVSKIASIPPLHSDIPSRFGLQARFVKWIRMVRSHPRILLKYPIRLATYLILLDLAYVFLYPFLYMVITSLKTNADLYDATVNWIPHTIKLANYSLAFKSLNFKTTMATSAIYTILGTLGHIISCSFVGYGFARYEFRGKKFWFVILLLSIIIPTQALIVPNYIMYANFGWIHTRLPIIVPTFLGYGLRGGLFIFIFRQFFQGLPKELEDAARVDGCGFLSSYIRIVLPCTRSAMLVTLVLSMVWHWNDFFEPSWYASRPDMRTLPAALQAMSELIKDPSVIADLMRESGLTDMEAVINNAVFMAGTFISIIPIFIIYAVLQKQFMQGIERTGLVE